MANITLKDFDGNRRNNFTTMRIFFALSVLYGHSFAANNPMNLIDPVTLLLKCSTWIGDIAVNGFFVISGYLVSASFVKRGLKDYTISRILRIYPALIVCVFLSTFILGPLMTQLNVHQYFLESETYSYLTNALGFIPKKWYLPGLFETNINKSVNGSLWTLTLELRIYFLLAVVGVLGVLRDRTVANVFMLACFLFGAHFFNDFPVIALHPEWAKTSLYFLLGIFLYVNRDKVILSGRLAILASAIALYALGKTWFNNVFPFVFVYLVFYLAYRTKYIDADGKIGDISYGIYIYAFPVQQIVYSFWPRLSPYASSLIAGVIVVGLALISWHFIEKPMLGLKKKMIRSNTGRSTSDIVHMPQPYHIDVTEKAASPTGKLQNERSYNLS